MESGQLSNNPAVAAAQIQGTVQGAMMKKSMDSAKDFSLQMIQGMQKAMQPHLGQNVDVTV
jgi:hypothetical protein